MIPFRTRQLLRRIAVTVLVLVLIAAVVLGCWVLWLDRYIIYTRDGVKLDFDLPPSLTPGRPAVPPAPGKPVDIVYQEDIRTEDPEASPMAQMSGVYADIAMLTEQFDATAENLRQLDPAIPILLDVRNLKGDFFYSSDQGKTASGMDAEAVTALIMELKADGHYLIARMPAFREHAYILEDETERVPYGLPRAGGGGSLWLDESGPNYWLDPRSNGTLSRLIAIITELKLLGFDEVVLDDFRIPDTDRIVFEADRAETIADTASALVKVCGSENFTVSFVAEDPAFPLPQEHSRLYLRNAEASRLAELASQTGLEDPTVRLVFLTELLDTRFDTYSVLRPADSVHHE